MGSRGAATARHLRDLDRRARRWPARRLHREARPHHPLADGTVAAAALIAAAQVRLADKASHHTIACSVSWLTVRGPAIPDCVDVGPRLKPEGWGVHRCRTTTRMKLHRNPPR